MKKLLITITLCICLSLCVCAANPGQFTDLDGHWAAASLEAAVQADVLRGMGENTLAPNAPVTVAQAVTMLDRILGLELAEAAPGELWYAPAMQAAEEAGLLLYADTLNPDKNLTRSQAFLLLANAFQLHTAQTACLDVFSDTASLTGPSAWSAAGLVDMGAAQGSGNQLRPQSAITRAEFVTLLHRLTGLQQDGGLLSVQTDTAFRLTGETLETGLFLSDAVRTINLQAITAEGPVILRSRALDSFRTSLVKAPRMVLAADADLTLASGTFDTIQIGQGDGNVTITGNRTPILEVFANNRTIHLQNTQLESLTILGSGNTILLSRDCQVDSLHILSCAQGNTVTVNCGAEFIQVSGDATTLKGAGKAQTLVIAAAESEVSLDAEERLEDNGLQAVSINLTGSNVAPGEPLVVTASISYGDAMEKTCKAQWYLDGQPVTGFSNAQFPLFDGAESTFRQELQFTRDMALNRTVALQLEYDNPITGESEICKAEITVKITNYEESYFVKRDKELAAQVSCHYVGDFTMDYDIDYSTEVKEAFVNVTGYSSQTEYLLWVNRHTQKVNIFTGSKGNWELLTTYRCASGAMSTPTPIGVTYVTYKQDAWYMGSYNVYWITRFYPNTGYAFHSRGYYANNPSVAMFPEIGYPMSAGCIRLYDDAAIWIHKNIPLNTTVVIY